MIQIIGIMIGMYIITRMGEIIERKEFSFLLKIFAVLTAIVAMFGIFDLIVTGSRTPSSIP
jgi:hypothetical protein